MSHSLHLQVLWGLGQLIQIDSNPWSSAAPGPAIHLYATAEPSGASQGIPLASPLRSSICSIPRPSGPVPEQFQPRTVKPADGHEPGGRGAEDELEHLAGLAAHLDAPAVLVHGEHRGELEAAAEVGDPRGRADAGDGS
jgi:hypothetical protein